MAWHGMAERAEDVCAWVWGCSRIVPLTALDRLDDGCGPSGASGAAGGYSTSTTDHLLQYTLYSLKLILYPLSIQRLVD